jgi:hypothetical protein
MLASAVLLAPLELLALAKTVRILHQFGSATSFSPFRISIISLQPQIPTIMDQWFPGVTEAYNSPVGVCSCSQDKSACPMVDDPIFYQHIGMEHGMQSFAGRRIRSASLYQARRGGDGGLDLPLQFR